MGRMLFLLLLLLLPGWGALLTSRAALAAPVIEKRDSVPGYVLDYAPLVYLHSQDPYLPSDIGAQVSNTQPEVNFQLVSGFYDLSNLDALHGLGGTDVYLTSKVDITTSPAFLHGVAPDSSGKTENAVTCAVLTTDHGNGTVDAFYMYFYAFNWGGLVLDLPFLNFGNHVGDWEHNMIRFQDGEPTYIWYAQHSNGQAFKYDILEKSGMRPIVYSSNGSHANYATEGSHEHTIPNLNLPIQGILTDHTDKGKLWDPILSAYLYSFSNVTGTPTVTPYSSSSSNSSSSYPTGWLYFNGRWGDEQYPDSDARQVEIADQPKYASGPTGPLFKQLNRTDICPDNGVLCILRDVISAK